MAKWGGVHEFGCSPHALSERITSASRFTLAVNPETVCPDFPKNVVAADAKYKGKRLNITGVLTTLSIVPGRSAMSNDDPDDRDADRPRRRDRDEESRPARRRRGDNYQDEYPRRRRRDESQATVSVLGVISLVKGILALITSLIPCFGMFAIGIAAIALTLGIIGIIVAKRSKTQGMGLPVAGTVVSGLAVAFSIMWILIGAAFFGTMKQAQENFVEQARTAASGARRSPEWSRNQHHRGGTIRGVQHE